jgi:hypothetical protein
MRENTMTDEQVEIAKTIMKRIVCEKIPKAKRWPVSREFGLWIDSLSKDQFQLYLDRLRLLTRALSEQETSKEERPRETGPFILFGSYSPSEAASIQQLARIGGEATAYYALALWRTVQVEEFPKMNSNKQVPAE